MAKTLSNKMKFSTFFMNTISEGKNPSSKRVAGCLGWILCLVAAGVAIFKIIPSPDIIEMLFWASCALLGIDSVTSMYKPFKKKNDEENKIQE